MVMVSIWELKLFQVLEVGNLISSGIYGIIYYKNMVFYFAVLFSTRCVICVIVIGCVLFAVL